MKTEELTALGLTQEQIDAVMKLNGQAIAAAQKAVTDITAERDSLSGQLKTATDALTKFKDLDIDGIKKQAADAKKALEEATQRYTADLTARDQRAWLKERFDKLGIKSPYARKQLAAEIMGGDAGTTWKDNGFYGFDDYIKKAKELDPALCPAEEKPAEKPAEEPKKPQFTVPAGTPGPDKAVKPVPTIW